MTNKCRLLTVRKVEGKGDNHLGFDFEIRGEKASRCRESPVLSFMSWNRQVDVNVRRWKESNLVRSAKRGLKR